jgi:hypothetical protein
MRSAGTVINDCVMALPVKSQSSSMCKDHITVPTRMNEKPTQVPATVLTR